MRPLIKTSTRDPREQMCVLFLGQPGIGREQVMAALDQTSVSVPGLWKAFDFEHEFLYPSGTVRPFLSDRPHRRRQAWANAFRELVDAVDSCDAQHVGVFLHGYFWFAGDLFHSLNLQDIRAIDPTVVVTLVDDVFDVHSRINAREDRYDTGASELLIPQIMTWRSAELDLADLIASDVRVGRQLPHFAFAVKHSGETLWQLLLDRRRLTIYTSFPITRAIEPREDVTESRCQSLRAEINFYRATLREDPRFTVLDPLTIDEHRYRSDGTRRWRWPLDELPPMVPAETGAKEGEWYHARTEEQLETPDIRTALVNEIKVQIQRRDFRMIDAADVVAAYRPSAFTSVPSAGTSAELRYGMDTNKHLYVVHDPTEDGGKYIRAESPFGDDVRPLVVPTSEELCRQLGELYDQRHAAFDLGEEPAAWTDRAGTVLRR